MFEFGMIVAKVIVKSHTSGCERAFSWADINCET